MKGTNRRAFLGGLIGAVAAAAAFDPERALWVPGKKHISIPAYHPSHMIVVIERHMVKTHWENSLYNWHGECVGGFDSVSYRLEAIRMPDRPNGALPANTVFVFRDGKLIGPWGTKEGLVIESLPVELQRIYLKALGSPHPIDMDEKFIGMA